MSHAPTYRYLYVDGGWPLLERSGVEVRDDGALTLARLPNLDTAVTEPLPPVPGLEGPAGIAVDPCGTVYIADPASHRILRLGACDERAEPLPCLRGPGSQLGELRAPRGVAVGPRGALYIADSENHRVQVVDLRTERPRAAWGQPSLAADPEPAEGAGRFLQPWDVAVDGRGRVYVADPGLAGPDGVWRGGSVQRFRADGVVDAEFWETVRAQPRRPAAPVSVVVAVLDPARPREGRLLVLDRRPPQLLAYALDGTFDAEATGRWAQIVGATGAPVSLAAAGGALYVADATGARVLAFGTDGTFHGAVPARAGALAGIGVDCEGRLLAHPGAAGGAVQRALGRPAFAECGTFLLGPFEAPSEPSPAARVPVWQRLQAEVPPLAAGAHLRFHTLTSDTDDGSPGRRPAPPVACDGSTATVVVPDTQVAPARHGEWRAAPWDATDLYVHNEPGRWLWIAGEMRAGGGATPVVRQIRVEHDVDGWLRWLPALYRNDDTSRLFLERALALFASLMEEQDRLIDDLPLLFDPWAAPDAGQRPSWLDWLAAWVDVELDERWDDATRRRTVAEAFRTHARRGTLDGVRRRVALYTGAVPRIEEVARPASPWALGAPLALGVDTALAPAAPEGAVLDATAVVDRSYLTEGEAFGAPLFEEAAHRFVVQVYAADVPAPEDVARLRRVLDREKPAHTTYHLCVVGARMRVGFQARLGIDAIVGGAPLPAPLDAGARLGTEMVLGGAWRGTGSALGEDARLGGRATMA